MILSAVGRGTNTKKASIRLGENNGGLVYGSTYATGKEKRATTAASILYSMTARASRGVVEPWRVVLVLYCVY